MLQYKLCFSISYASVLGMLQYKLCFNTNIMLRYKLLFGYLLYFFILGIVIHQNSQVCKHSFLFHIVCTFTVFGYFFY